MKTRRLVRLLVWLIGFVIGFVYLFSYVMGLVATEGETVYDAIFLGGVFGLLCGYILFFIETKIEPRVWKVA